MELFHPIVHLRYVLGCERNSEILDRDAVDREHFWKETLGSYYAHYRNRLRNSNLRVGKFAGIDLKAGASTQTNVRAHGSSKA